MRRLAAGKGAVTASRYYAQDGRRKRRRNTRKKRREGANAEKEAEAAKEEAEAEPHGLPQEKQLQGLASKMSNIKKLRKRDLAAPIKKSEVAGCARTMATAPQALKPTNALRLN